MWLRLWDRLFWVMLSRLWSCWREALVIVKPETVIASLDFLVVPTAAFRMLYGLVVLGHDRRRIIHFAVTAHPTSVWVAQQM